MKTIRAAMLFTRNSVTQHYTYMYSKRHYSQNAQLYVDTEKTAFLSFFVTILRIGLLNVDRHFFMRSNHNSHF